MQLKTIEMIQEVAKGLRDLKDDCVFVGGATVALYLNLDTAEEIRPTEDVDVIIEIASTLEYMKFSKRLTKMKFLPDPSAEAPICRWKYLGVTVDIMPLDESVLGFSNKVYKSAFEYRKEFTLPDNQRINILPIGYFLETKCEAYFSRGHQDPRFSKDLEDIVALLSDPLDFEEILKNKELVLRLRASLKKIFEDENAVEAIRGFLQGGVTGQFEIIKNRALLKV